MRFTIPSHVDVTDDGAIVALLRHNPACKLEIAADGNILISQLTGTDTGPKELEAGVQLALYARAAGGRAFGASAGFRLPDRSLLGPDAAWISRERLAGLGEEATKGAFWHVCPDVVVEVLSESDSWIELRRKVERFLENGADYAVAIDCERRVVFEAGIPPAGLALDFDRIFDA